MVKENLFIDVEFGVLETLISSIIKALRDGFGHREDEAFTHIRYGINGEVVNEKVSHNFLFYL